MLREKTESAQRERHAQMKIDLLKVLAKPSDKQVKINTGGKAKLPRHAKGAFGVNKRKVMH